MWQAQERSQHLHRRLRRLKRRPAPVIWTNNADDQTLAAFATVSGAKVGLYSDDGCIAGNIPFVTGAQTAQGFAAGILSQLKSIDAASSAMDKTVVATVKRELGIKSPSTVLRLHGQHAGAGFALGVADQAGLVAAATRQLSAAATPARAPVAINPGASMAGMHITGDLHISEDGRTAKLVNATVGAAFKSAGDRLTYSNF